MSTKNTMLSTVGVLIVVIPFLVSCEESERLYNNEMQPTADQVEESAKIQDLLDRGIYVFNGKELPRDEYEQIIAKKIDTGNSNDAMSRIENVNQEKLRLKVASQPDIPAMLDHISFLGGVDRTIEDDIIVVGTKKSETVPFAFIESQKGNYMVSNPIIPLSKIITTDNYVRHGDRKLSRSEIARDERIVGEVNKHLEKMGVDKEEVKIKITSMMSRTTRNGEKITREHQRIVYVHRYIDGIRVDNNRAVFGFTLDGQLKSISANWNQINYSESKFKPSVGLEDMYQKVVVRLADDLTNPYDLDMVEIEPRYLVEKTESGEYVLNVKSVASYTTVSAEGLTNAESINIEI